jgi:UDP-N-acetylmuramyl pentapeptide phosphotransferase/UDP-N-acetylglucosamine-1-phosphate transferase
MKLSAEILEMICRTAPYVAIFAGSLALSLVLTPLVTSLNRRLGMVDNPGGRRINKSPVPRGGGVAVIASFVVSVAVFALFSKGPVSPAFPDSVLWKMIALSVALGTQAKPSRS